MYLHHELFVTLRTVLELALSLVSLGWYPGDSGGDNVRVTLHAGCMGAEPRHPNPPLCRQAIS